MIDISKNLAETLQIAMVFIFFGFIVWRFTR